MEKLLLKKHGVTVSLVGASLVFGTMFGKCTVEPKIPGTVEEILVEEVETVEEIVEVEVVEPEVVEPEVVAVD